MCACVSALLPWQSKSSESDGPADSSPRFFKPKSLYVRHVKVVPTDPHEQYVSVEFVSSCVCYAPDMVLWLQGEDS